MTRRLWIHWTLVFLALIALGEAIGWLLIAQGLSLPGRIFRILGWSAANLWLYWAFWRSRHFRWAKISATLLLATHLIAALVAILYYRYQATAWATALLGIWAMALALMLGLTLIRLVLSPAHPILGVARTLVDEAIRMKIASVFLVLLTILIPVLPAILDPNELLHYRLRTFLSWSVSSVALLTSLMTVFLAVGTVCNEISQRQIFLTLTKPISRAQYLLGKWLGILLLDLWLVLVAALGIYSFARFLAAQPARDDLDRQAVDHHVLVGRASAKPTPPPDMNFDELVRQQLEQIRRENQERLGTADQPRPFTRADLKTAEKRVTQRWHTIPPNSMQRYVFTGLQPAVQRGPTMQLRFKGNCPWTVDRTDKLTIQLYLNGRAWPIYEGQHLAFTPTNNEFFVIELPTAAVDEAGRLELGIVHRVPPEVETRRDASLTITPDEGLEILYEVSSFEENLARAVALLLIRLMLLAALGLAAGAFLSFPVACLATLLILIAGTSSDFLAEALAGYATSPDETLGLWDKILWPFQTFFQALQQGQFANAVKLLIKLTGTATLALTPKLSQFNPSPLLADGRVISSPLLWKATWQILALWTIPISLIGWWLFSRREIAALAT